MAHAPGIQGGRAFPAARYGFEPRLAVQVALVAALAAAAPIAIGVAIDLRLTLIALAGFAVVVLAIRHLDLAVLLFVATIPLEAAFQSASSTLTITKAAGALCFFSFLVHCVLTRRQLRLDQSHVVVLLLLVVALLASLTAREVASGLETTVRYGSFVLLYIMLTQLAGDRAFQRRLVWALSAAATASAILGIRLYLDGETYFATLPNENQNDFAFILATTIPLTCWLVLGSRTIGRVVAVAMVGLMTAGVILSFSRGAAVALAAGILVAVLGDRRRIVLGIGIGLVGLAAAWGAIRADPERFETSSVVKSRAAATNISSRVETWTAAVWLTAEHPALGVGPGNFQYHFYEATGRIPGTENLFVVHNAYLDVMVELGIVGFFLFLGYLGLAYSRARAVERGGTGPPGYALALRIALVVALTGAMFLSEQYVGPFWVLGALAAGLWSEQRRRGAAEATA